VATVAIVSDIHANAVALDAVLAELERIKPDQVVCLGDVAATGPAPAEVIARLRARDWRFVRGNCDDALLRFAAGAGLDSKDAHDAIDQWCATQLDAEAIAFLATFEPVVTIEAGGKTICCYHGSPHSNLDEIVPETLGHELDRWLMGQHADIYAGGHTHIQMVKRHREAYVINAGSIGLPFTYEATGDDIFNPSWAEFAVVEIDGDRVDVSLRRIPVNREAALTSANESGMPHLEWWAGDWR
jgi:putative phosphoesterase